MKEEATTSITFLNIEGIPLVNTHPKSQEIQSFVRDVKVDILGLTEMNVNWSLVNNWN